MSAPGSSGKRFSAVSHFASSWWFHEPKACIVRCWRLCLGPHLSRNFLTGRSFWPIPQPYDGASPQLCKKTESTFSAWPLGPLVLCLHMTMSEDTQPRTQRVARSERMTTSCGECRRRKQKVSLHYIRNCFLRNSHSPPTFILYTAADVQRQCNQGQPCSNCARRFPQPVCEYRTTSNRYVTRRRDVWIVEGPETMRGCGLMWEP